MDSKTLNRLLNTALELLLVLEQYADETTQREIDALFDEVNAEDSGIFADLEAQDFDTFGEKKV
tara:strand:- start:522 stop:713 length:192 start_codon:yes stop_codon:yes gene_type:complete